MENDSIRASGSDTLVDIWINGKLRAICVTREAIDTYLGFERAARMSEDDRCEFVRTHLPLVVTAVRTKLRDSNPAADAVVLEGEQLGGPGSGRAGDRRKVERRKAERRKVNTPKDQLPHGERRRGERRKTGRRTPKKPS
jgi:hypothetical protein